MTHRCCAEKDDEACSACMVCLATSLFCMKLGEDRDEVTALGLQVCV